MSNARFVYEMPIVARTGDLHEVRMRLDVARRVYNALVSEALRRVDLYKQSREFRRLRGQFRSCARAAKLIGDGKDAKSVAARKAVWAPYYEAKNALRARLELRGSYSLGKDATSVAQSIPLWAQGHGIGAQVVHALSARCWVAIEKYLDALDRGKKSQFARPRFRRMGEVRSVDGTGSTPAIRLSDDGEMLVWAAGKNGGQIAMPIRWPKRLDAHDQHARGLILAGEVAGTRLLLRTIGRKRLVYAQATLKGAAIREPALMPRQDVTIGADMCFREVAFVTPDRAGILPLSEDAARVDRELAAQRRRYQRAMDRSRRASNPDNYHANGTVKPRGQRKRWVRSKRYREIQVALAEDQRRVAAIRKTETGRVLNTLLPLGYELRIEDLSYASWQRGKKRVAAKKAPRPVREGGRTSRVFAPGEFVARAHTKWAQYGGSVIDIDSKKARLSELCHACGQYTPQPSLGRKVFRRRHLCACGVEPVQADLYQAFLARFASSEGNVDLPLARKSWAGAVKLLAAAGSTYQRTSPASLRAPARPDSRRPASESVAAESAPLGSQDSARRSGVRPRGADGGNHQPSAADKDRDEKSHDAPIARRRSKPVGKGVTAKPRSVRRGQA